MEKDFNQQLTVEIPRSILLRLRRQYPGESVEACVRKAAEELAGPGGGKVVLSQGTVRELCSIFNVSAVNSEKDILQAARERLHMGPDTVVFDLDPTLAVSVRECADANDEPFSHRLREYLQMAIEKGYFEENYVLSALFFSLEQWKSLRELMDGKLSAENVVAAVQHWKRLTASELAAQR